MCENTRPEITITFDPEPHEYWINGRKADITVTGIIEKMVTKDEYVGIPADILQRAADRGTRVHKDLEDFISLHTEPQTPEGQEYAKYIKEHNWVIEDARTEFQLAIEHTAYDEAGNPHSFILAGTADILCKLNGVRISGDYKTTSEIHYESVAWQTSLLDYMARAISGCLYNGEPFDYEPAEKRYVFHFSKVPVFTPAELKRIPDEEIVRMLDAYALGKEYYPTTENILTPKQQQSLEDIETKLATLEVMASALKLEKAKLQSEMLSAFRAHPEVKSVKFPSVTVTYIAPTTRTAFNTAQFRADHPDLYNQYLTTSDVSDTIKITLAAEVKRQIEAQNHSLPAPQPAEQRNKQTKRGFFG